MKTASLLLALLFAVCVIGCEDPKLATCQSEKDALTTQLDQAKATIAEKDNKIEALKTKNTEDQTKAMESITVMMQKQAEKDNKIKQSLVEKTQKIKVLETKVATMKVEMQNAQKGLKAAEQEKQALMKKIEEIQKAAVAPAP